MTGVLDEATETWTDLDEMLAAELPPCEVRRASGATTPEGHRRAAVSCRAPSVAVLTLACPRCGPWRRAACAGHVRELRELSGRVRCGFCMRALVTVEGLS